MIGCSACGGGTVRDFESASDDGAAASEREAHDASPAEEIDAGPDLASLWRDQPLYRSGSRLRARLVEADGDASLFAGFHDAAPNVGVDCTYALAEDGAHRCLPTTWEGQVRFLDADCRRPVLLPYVGSEPHGCRRVGSSFTTASLPPEGGCSEEYRTRVFRIGAPHGDVPVFELAADGCKPAGVKQCLRQLEVMPPQHFLRAQMRLEVVDPDISIRWVDYDDTARQLDTLVDSHREVGCLADPVLAPERCVPTSTAHVFVGGAHGSGDMFSQQTCSGAQVAWDFAREPCVPAAIAIVWQPNACARYDLTMFELGAQVQTAYTRDELGCVALQTTSYDWFFELGPRLDPDTLPKLRRAQAGAGRLAVSYYAAASGRPVQTAGDQFYDRTLDRPCLPQRMADDTLRCVPNGETVTIDPAGPYADSACAEALVHFDALDAATTEGACASNTLAVRNAPQLQRPEAFYDRGARRDDLRTVFFLESEGCVAREVDPSQVYYALGPKLELDVVHERIE
jgi:hypothetical protein